MLGLMPCLPLPRLEASVAVASQDTRHSPEAPPTTLCLRFHSCPFAWPEYCTSSIWALSRGGTAHVCSLEPQWPLLCQRLTALHVFCVYGKWSKNANLATVCVRES